MTSISWLIHERDPDLVAAPDRETLIDEGRVDERLQVDDESRAHWIERQASVSLALRRSNTSDVVFAPDEARAADAFLEERRSSLRCTSGRATRRCTVAVVEGWLNQPLPGAMQAMRWAAANAGYALAEAQCGPTWLSFKKGVTFWSWGSQLSMAFMPTGPASTRITVTTSETFAITDWGRGKRATRRLFDAVGATYNV